ncbi:endoglucanase E-4-like [Scylla paramamosain]|uniref:endoglucanase E-4-like n=1 Tax=Scylla paramamosain TaxID=85552 RepID=UPI003083E046
MWRKDVLFPIVGLLFVLIDLTIAAGVGAQRCDVISIVEKSSNSYAAKFTSQTEFPFVGVNVVFTFDHPVTSVINHNGKSEMMDDMHVRMTDEYHFVETGVFVHFSFEVFHSGDTQPEVIAVDLNGQDACDGSMTWATDAPYIQPCQKSGTTPYDYSQVLCMSFLFYEAQRSGVPPPDQRVKPWRWDSALNDGAEGGHDLTGGYYDAGDHVKFGFPMASTTIVLAWGLIDFPMGYEQTGQTEYARAAVKWATDYFLKTHAAEYELNGQHPPIRAHHRSSSCPNPPDSCAQNNWGYEQPGPNPHVLHDAIVGGPAEDGTWEDDRLDYVHNEVACDYSAVYTGALAAIIEMGN